MVGWRSWSSRLLNKDSGADVPIVFTGEGPGFKSRSDHILFGAALRVHPFSLSVYPLVDHVDALIFLLIYFLSWILV